VVLLSGEAPFLQHSQKKTLRLTAMVISPTKAKKLYLDYTYKREEAPTAQIRNNLLAAEIQIQF